MATTNIMDVETTYDEEPPPPHPPDPIHHDPHVVFLEWKANMDRLYPIYSPSTPPPRPPDPPKPENVQTYSQLILQQWDELIAKISRKQLTPLNTKLSSRSFAYTIDELIENKQMIDTILNVNVLICVQCDGGANTSVTNDHPIMHHVVDIKLYSISGIGSGIICTKKGTFYLQCEKSDVLPVHIFYEEQATETVISPAIVTHNSVTFDSWTQTSNVKLKTGYLIIYSDLGLHSFKVNLHMTNKIWFMRQPRHSISHYKSIVYEYHKKHTECVNRIKAHEAYDLWHYCLGHAGEHAIS